jgi:hypothetical protein
LNPELSFAILLSVYFLSPLHRRYLRWLLRNADKDSSRKNREILLWQLGAVAMVMIFGLSHALS